MKKLNQPNQTNETNILFLDFELLNQREMLLVKGGDGDVKDELPNPPPPPPPNN